MFSFSVVTLSLSQVRAVYRERMKDDFPPDEIKPLAMIERAMGRGRRGHPGLRIFCAAA